MEVDREGGRERGRVGEVWNIEVYWSWEESKRRRRRRRKRRRNIGSETKEPSTIASTTLWCCVVSLHFVTSITSLLSSRHCYNVTSIITSLLSRHFYHHVTSIMSLLSRHFYNVTSIITSCYFPARTLVLNGRLM